MPSERADRLTGVGVVCHLIRPSLEDCVRVAATAEASGADWCVLPDVVGWPDVWMCLTAAAASTSRILIGPGVTNPYTRHPMVTVSALGTLDEVSDGRAFLGVGAGGTELTTALGINRSDAPQRVRDLADTLRKRGGPVADAPILAGARGRRMLEAAAAAGDLVLLWGMTPPDLRHAARVVAEQATAVAWSPLLRSDGEPVRVALVYAILNSPVATRRGLGVDGPLEARLRERLQEGISAAAALLPDSVADGYLSGDDLGEATEEARRLDASCITVQAFDVETLPRRVAWARRVVSGSGVAAVEEPT
jgi:alkanesulfonate monooxygenase SsuD/methylene tetrahydromethanopterin reductase-like flavin-dependent oxidoreductase (luciferase family)